MENKPVNTTQAPDRGEQVILDIAEELLEKYIDAFKELAK